jgi:DNA-binding NtrC family response regulator
MSSSKPGMPERNEGPQVSTSEDTKLADEEVAVVERSHQRMASSRAWDFAFRGKLYGRAKEMDELLEVYRRVSKQSGSKTELVLVSGSSGVGKVSHFRCVF